MKPIRLFLAAGLGSGLVSLLGCSTPVPATTPPPIETAVPVTVPRAAPPAQPAPPATPAAPSATAESKVTGVTLPDHLNPSSAISTERSVFFDFDDSVLRSEYAPLIERHARYLSTKAPLAVRIEGHADERGGAEYNLALGQRRAETVARALRLLGVKDGQLEAISHGEERPRASGHDETAWAQNRRADIAYPAR